MVRSAGLPLFETITGAATTVPKRSERERRPRTSLVAGLPWHPTQGRCAKYSLTVNRCKEITPSLAYKSLETYGPFGSRRGATQRLTPSGVGFFVNLKATTPHI